MFDDFFFKQVLWMEDQEGECEYVSELVFGCVVDYWVNDIFEQFFIYIDDQIVNNGVWD